MVTDNFNEDLLEDAVLDLLGALGYATAYGPNIEPVALGAERDSFDQSMLPGLLCRAIERINPGLTAELIDQAVVSLHRAESQDPIAENKRVHQLIVGGVPVEYRAADGSLRTQQVRLIDFEQPERNDWLAVNQFTVIENGKQRRADIVVFVNGLPLALFELKKLGAAGATIGGAWNQIQTYRSEVPSLFTANALTVLSDGLSAVMGTFTGQFEHYAPWKTIDSPAVVQGQSAISVLVAGVFDKARLLDLVQNFVVFSEEAHATATGQLKTVLVKRVAKYHQYWAVNAAVESTVAASAPEGDRRAGVVWHTQGSGKSFEMVFYAAKIMRDPRMNNPTLVFITDRNDLDDQLFGEVFAPASILPEQPVQADSRDELRSLLQRSSGGIIFSTLHKFAPDTDRNPVLTDRSNVVVIADEAHRSQYGFRERMDASTGQLRGGLAQHLRDALPNASYLGFTGTPIETADKSTRAVFGDYIDTYDLTRAVNDGATVPIYYESRLAKVQLAADDLQALDELADQITEDVELSEAEQAKSRWSRLEAIVGAESRLDLIARDIVEHWELKRDALPGKAMIVVMSRRIAVRLYEKIVALRPDWHSDELGEGRIKVVMTGSAADPAEFQPHIHTKEDRKKLKARAKNPADPLELVIVRDMWLTGFDAPAMHTMYLDKTMQGAGLMQAIARVNRTFGIKEGGLIVDYIGIFTNLQQALKEYSPSDREQVGEVIEAIVQVLLEKHQVLCNMVHEVGFDSSPELSPTERLAQYAALFNFVVADEARQPRFLNEVLALSKAFGLAGADPRAAQIRDDVRMFVDVRAAILKALSPGGNPGKRKSVEVDAAIGQLVNEAVSADEVIDIYQIAGVDTPDLSLLSDEFLESLTSTDKPHLQRLLLERLINDQLRTVQRRNLVQAKRFSAQLTEAINRYTSRAITSAEVLAELAELALEMKRDAHRAEELGLTDDELAFYDAITQNDSAVLTLGDGVLRAIAHDLVDAVRNSATIDWRVKAAVRAEMRSKIKRLLAKHGYPPDAQQLAVDLVIEQAELLAA